MKGLLSKENLYILFLTFSNSKETDGPQIFRGVGVLQIGLVMYQKYFFQIRKPHKRIYC